MISLNFVIQLGALLTQYRKKSLMSKLYEILITLTFLRPAVDAYRVSSNHDDDENNFDSLTEVSDEGRISLASQ